jgi:hypothetical protein
MDIDAMWLGAKNAFPKEILALDERLVFAVWVDGVEQTLKAQTKDNSSAMAQLAALAQRYIKP